MAFLPPCPARTLAPSALGWLTPRRHALSPAPRTRPASRHLPPRMDLPSTGVFDPATRPERIRAIVFGATGYIGRAVVWQFLEQGYSVTAFVRAKSGVSGRDGVEELRGLFPGAQVVVGDVTKRETIGGAFEGLGSGASVVVSCLASRSGGIEDSNRVDYEATLNVLETAWERGVKHFVLLSAVCVQKPELEFQRAKLKFEAELAGLAEREPEFSYAVVRPTAFFKSLAGQVERVKKGAAFVMFGDGDLCRCNAISERDLARFIVECGRDEGKRNQVLAVGGPGKAVTPREQGEMLFRVLGKEEKFMRVPIAVMDVAVGVLGGLAKVFPGLRDVAEFGKIGRYYAVEDMVAPGWGEDGLEEFFREAVKEGGMEGQDLGAAKVF